MHPSEPTPVPMRTVLSHMLTPIVMALIMALCYFGGLHRPDPRELPVAVVGSVETAEPVAARLQQAAGDRLDVRTVATPEEATRQLRTQQIHGAYVPSAQRPTLLVASAASHPATSVATQVFTTSAAAQGRPLTVQDVAPLPASDPIGQNAFFYLVALSIGAYATAIAIAVAGASRRFRERLILSAAASVVVPTVLLAAASIAFDMFAGHGPAVWALSVGYALIVISLSVGLHTFIGRYSTLVFNALFVALNFTSSEGIFPTSMQPPFFEWLASFWVGAGFIDVLTRILYLPELDISHALGILAGWLLVAAGTLAAAHHTERRRRRAAAFVASHEGLRKALAGRRSDGLTEREAMELELAEDVAV